MRLLRGSAFQFVDSPGFESGEYILAVPRLGTQGPFLWKVGRNTMAFRFGESGVLECFDQGMIQACYGLEDPDSAPRDAEYLRASTIPPF